MLVQDLDCTYPSKLSKPMVGPFILRICRVRVPFSILNCRLIPFHLVDFDSISLLFPRSTYKQLCLLTPSRRYSSSLTSVSDLPSPAAPLQTGQRMLRARTRLDRCPESLAVLKSAAIPMERVPLHPAQIPKLRHGRQTVPGLNAPLVPNRYLVIP